VVILQTIIKKDFKTITIYMVFIGWLASGAGLFVALENLIFFVPVILLFALLKIMTTQYIPNNKEVKYV
jgi:beta-carotene 15,15'-dioxygenase